jgi:hypothetical protein
MNNSFNLSRSFFGRNITPVLGAIATVILAIGLLYVGIGILSILVLFLLLPIAILFGYLGELVGSIIFVLLLKNLGPDIFNLINIWGKYPKIEQTINFINSHDTLKAIMIVFFPAFVLAFITRSINCFGSVQAAAQTKNKKFKSNRSPIKITSATSQFVRTAFFLLHLLHEVKKSSGIPKL